MCIAGKKYSDIADSIRSILKGKINHFIQFQISKGLFDCMTPAYSHLFCTFNAMKMCRFPNRAARGFHLLQLIFYLGR